MSTLPVFIDQLTETRDRINEILSGMHLMAGAKTGGLVAPGTPLAADPKARLGSNSIGLGPHALASMRTSEAIVAVLRLAGAPLNTRGILQLLLAHGYNMRSTQPTGSLRSTLLRLEKQGVVDRIATGLWRLLRPDWEPTAKEGGYHAFIADRLREGSSMPEAAALWRALQEGLVAPKPVKKGKVKA